LKVLGLSPDEIKRAAEEGRITLGVIGLGYIGLPTALLFAKANLRVIGRDIDASKVEMLRKGEVYAHGEKGLKELLVAVKEGFTPTTDMKDLAGADVFILSVSTLVDSNNEIDLSHIEQASADLAPCLSKDALVIVESTVPPGTTEGKIIKILERGSRLKAGNDFGVAMCPERANPGAILATMKTRKRVVGALDERSLRAATALYALISEHEPVEMPDIRTAEIVKVVENSLRDVEIAYANIIALYCEQMKVDVRTVVDAVNTHPGRVMRMPGAGVGGACIPVNPYFIIQTAKNRFTSMLSEARKINDYMAHHVAEQVWEWMKKEGVRARPSVLMLGYAYKANIGDVRFSPSSKILGELVKKGIKVSVYDPLASAVVSEEERQFFVDELFEAAEGVHCIIATVGHDVFMSLKFEVLVRLMKKPLFYDCTFSFDADKLCSVGFKYRGVGRAS
jgi:nucleotide sugar dehydrogenase